MDLPLETNNDIGFLERGAFSFAAPMRIQTLGNHLWDVVALKQSKGLTKMTRLYPNDW